MRRVLVHIDNLVLKGFRCEDRHSFSAALQEELARALAAPEAARQLTALKSTPYMRIGHVNVQAGAKPRQVGVVTANAVGRGLIK
jgi:hypothetical protein